MPYSFVADSVCTKKLCSILSSSEVRFYTEMAVLRFEPIWGTDHLRLIGKRVVDFLIVLVELCSLGVTAEAQRANIGPKSAISLQQRRVDPKFRIEWVAPTNHSSSQQTILNCLLYTSPSPRD